MATPPRRMLAKTRRARFRRTRLAGPRRAGRARREGSRSEAEPQRAAVGEPGDRDPREGSEADHRRDADGVAERQAVRLLGRADRKVLRARDRRGRDELVDVEADVEGLIAERELAVIRGGAERIEDAGVQRAVAAGLHELERDVETLRAVTVGAHDDRETGRREFGPRCAAAGRYDKGHGLSRGPGLAVRCLQRDAVEAGRALRERRPTERHDREHGQKERESKTSHVRLPSVGWTGSALPGVLPCSPPVQRPATGGSLQDGAQFVGPVGARVLEEHLAGLQGGDIAHAAGAARGTDDRPIHRYALPREQVGAARKPAALLVVLVQRRTPVVAAEPSTRVARRAREPRGETIPAALARAEYDPEPRPLDAVVALGETGLRLRRSGRQRIATRVDVWVLDASAARHEHPPAAALADDPWILHGQRARRARVEDRADRARVE